jgi:hypothetical protein
MANFTWCMGDTICKNWPWLIPNGDSAEAFYERFLTAAQWLGVTSVAWNGTYFFVLVPLDVFSHEREHPESVRLERTSPQPRLPRFFRDFRNYECFALFWWSVKDALWAWNQPYAYTAVFFFVVLLNADLVWMLATHRDQYIDLVFQIVICLWVAANGTWAFSEMAIETALTITDPLYTDYLAFGPYDPIFRFRRAGGYLFCAQAVLVVLFLAQWITLSLLRRRPSYSEYLAIALEEEDEEEEDGLEITPRISRSLSGL